MIIDKVDVGSSASGQAINVAIRADDERGEYVYISHPHFAASLAGGITVRPFSRGNLQFGVELRLGDTVFGKLGTIFHEEEDGNRKAHTYVEELALVNVSVSANNEHVSVMLDDNTDFRWVSVDENANRFAFFATIHGDDQGDDPAVVRVELVFCES